MSKKITLIKPVIVFKKNSHCKMLFSYKKSKYEKEVTN